jgi:PAS domain S-box-containing protein
VQFTIPPFLIYWLRVLWLFLILPALVFGGWWLLSEELALFPSVPTLGVLLVGMMAYLWHRLRALPQRYAAKLHAADALQASQAEFAYLFEHSPVPYVNVRRDGTLTKANLAAVRLLATQTDRVSEVNLYQLFDAAGADEWHMIRSKVLQGVTVHDVECVLATVGGHQRWVRLSVFVSGVSEEEALVTLVDITQQKKIDQAKSEFVALASHQLRTPIAAISWNAELLTHGDTSGFSEKQLRYGEKIVANAQRMKALIDDFLSVSQLETGTFQADVQEVEFTQYLQEIIDEFEGTVSQKQLQVNLEAPPNPLQWQTDRRLLHIVTSNLISNAVKYTPASGQVRIGYQIENNILTFWVADSGIGIPSNELESLFTKFYRATNARKERAQGTGLGLYIVKQSVEMLGGQITVQSQQDVGTTFTVVIPLT